MCCLCLCDSACLYKQELALFMQKGKGGAVCALREARGPWLNEVIFHVHQYVCRAIEVPLHR